MDNHIKITVLGTGTSVGIPALGKLGWGKCDPSNPKNKRQRCAVLIQSKDTNILVDAGLDIKKDVTLISQAPAVGGSALQKNQIAAHADFVPFGELFPYKGFAKKIFDGAQTGVPTLHGITVREDFAKQCPEVVIAFMKSVIQANNKFQKRPEYLSSKIEEWSGIDKEVVYMFLGPSGLQPLTPEIKEVQLLALENSIAVLKSLGKISKNIRNL